VRVIRAAGFWLIAFAFAYGLWLVHDDSGKLPELVAGAGAAALAATGTELVRRQRIAAMAVRPRFLRHAVSLLPRAVRDCVTLTRLAFAQLLRPQPARGATVALSFRHGGDDPDAHGRRALGQALGSFAPATIVVGMDPDRDLLIAHQLPVSGDVGDLDPLGLA
jgi:hypothetical protein